jgi:hypothetical protein
MNKIGLILLGFLLASCSKEEIQPSSVCLDGSCDSFWEIDSLVSPGVYQDENGYWHITHQGYNYFTIKGKLDELDPHYEVNGVPLVETTFDSNYWVWIQNFQFTVPLYSVLSYFTSGAYQNPIPVGNLTYTIEDMAQNHPPLNIVGYQINKNQCLDCPYSQTLLGTYSKYTYEPQQQIFFDNEMVGDTATVMIETKFNSDIGPREIVKAEFKVIFE